MFNVIVSVTGITNYHKVNIRVVVVQIDSCVIGSTKIKTAGVRAGIHITILKFTA